jgi:YD repeat-containing protein
MAWSHSSIHAKAFPLVNTKADGNIPNRPTTNNSVNVTYNYSSTQNNGKITGQADHVTGEQLVFTYDALNRLASAATTAGTPTWGQSYSYDGFGNLTDQTVTAGTAPSLHVVYNLSNRQTTDGSDANGNINANTSILMSRP